MSNEQNMVVVTRGVDDERSSVAWSVANGAIATGFRVTMFRVSSGVDRVWIEVRDKPDDIVADLSMDEPAPDNAVTLVGGGITVPLQGWGNGQN